MLHFINVFVIGIILSTTTTLLAYGLMKVATRRIEPRKEDLVYIARRIGWAMLATYFCLQVLHVIH